MLPVNFIHDIRSRNEIVLGHRRLGVPLRQSSGGSSHLIGGNPATFAPTGVKSVIDFGRPVQKHKLPIELAPTGVIPIINFGRPGQPNKIPFSPFFPKITTFKGVKGHFTGGPFGVFIPDNSTPEQVKEIFRKAQEKFAALPKDVRNAI